MHSSCFIYDYLNAGKMYIKHRWDFGFFSFCLRREYLPTELPLFAPLVQVERVLLGKSV